MHATGGVEGSVYVGHMAQQVKYDRREQYEQIVSGLLPGEDILAVYDAVGIGTGFIGLTDRRVILQDRSFVGKRLALTSIPYGKVTAVSIVSNKSWAGSFFSSGNIAVHVGSQTWEIEVRGVEKTQHIHNLILHYATGH